MHQAKVLLTLCAFVAAAAPAQQDTTPFSYFTAMQSGNGCKIVLPKDGHRIEIVLRDGKVLSATCKDQPVLIKKTGTGGSRVTTEDGTELLVIEPTSDHPMKTLQTRRAHLGVSMGRIDDALAAHLDVKPDQVVMVLEATEGQPAHKAGIKKYDVIIGVDGETTATEERVRETIRSKKPGDKIKLKVQRGGGEKVIEVTLGEMAGLDTLFAGKALSGFDFKADPYRLLFGRSDQSGEAQRLFSTLQQGKSKPDGGEMKADLESIKKQLDRLDELLKTLGERMKEK